MISQERLSANRKSYIPHQLAQQRMTSSDLECLKSTLSVVAELLVGINFIFVITCECSVLKPSVYVFVVPVFAFSF